MTLLEWMRIKDLNVYKMAEMVSCSPFAVRKWIRRERTPRPETIKLIKRLTKNQVSGDDWLPIDT